MFHTKCGCPDCRNEHVPSGRWTWKARKNKRGIIYGSHRKSHGKKAQRGR